MDCVIIFRPDVVSIWRLEDQEQTVVDAEFRKEQKRYGQQVAWLKAKMSYVGYVRPLNVTLI